MQIQTSHLLFHKYRLYKIVCFELQMSSSSLLGSSYVTLTVKILQIYQKALPNQLEQTEALQTTAQGLKGFHRPPRR